METSELKFILHDVIEDMENEFKYHEINDVKYPFMKNLKH